MPAEIITIDELSARIKTSKWTIYGWVSKEFIPCVKLKGKLLFNWPIIEAWLVKNSHPGRSVRRLRIEQAMQGGKNG